MQAMTWGVRNLGGILVWVFLAGCGVPDEARESASPEEPARQGEARTATAGDAEARESRGRRKLRICADPNNLPFSNEAKEGFENRIAELVAEELDAVPTYTWWAQRRGFIRNTLRAGSCDLVVGLPSGFELALLTRPYYRSTYVFVHPPDSEILVESLDDPRLGDLLIGIHISGDDYQNPPGSQALATRGYVDNVRGYSIYGNYSEPNPPARIFDALDAGEIDVAIVWGPLAGFFSGLRERPFHLVPVTPQVDLPFLPFVFDISMGVRRGDDRLRDELDAILVDRRTEIEAILGSYGVPILGRPGPSPTVAQGVGS
jgi:mxaJ protein